MKKFWMVYCAVNAERLLCYHSYQEAEDAAKRLAFDNRGRDYVVLEAIVATRQPVPDVEMVKL